MLKTIKRLFITIILCCMAVTGQAQEVWGGHYAGNSQTWYNWQLSTNGIYWLALCPNITAEVQNSDGYALQLGYMGTWLNNNTSHRYWSYYGMHLEARYYIDGIYNYPPYVGHHFGVYGQWLTYDFEFGGTGYQSARPFRTWMAGVSYGYTFPLTKKLSLDLNIGIGFCHSGYDVYKPINDVGYYRTEKKNLNFVGPTRLEASLVYLINGKNE